MKLVDQQDHMENASKSSFIPEQLFTFHQLNGISSKQRREALKEAGALTEIKRKGAATRLPPSPQSTGWNGAI